MTLSAYNPSTRTFYENDATKPLDSDDLVTALADSRAIAVPAAPGQLLGGSGTAGVASAVTVGSGLSLTSGTLTATGGSGGTVYTFSTGLTNTAGTITVNFGGLGSAPTVAHSDHTHTIYAQTANNLSDVANVGTARTNLGLGNIATLAGTAQGQVAYYNGTAWTVLGAGTNGQVLTSGGVAANPSWTTVSAGSGSGTINSGTTNQLAYYAATGTAVSGLTFNTADFSISAGTISIQGTATHGLSTGAGLAAGDEIAVWSLAANSGAGGDVKYPMTTTVAYFLSNWPSWVTGSRPSLGSNFGAGFNTTLGRFEFWNGSAWNQHVRVTDLVATSSQLFGGTGTNGVAQAITLGSGLTLTGTTLSSSGGGASFYSRPALSTFSFVNQGTSTATEVSGGPIVLTIPPHTIGQNIVALMVALPTAPFTVTATMDTVAPAQTGGQYQTHLVMRNSSTGVVESLIFGASLHDVAVLNYTTVTSVNATRADQAMDLSSRLVRFRIVNDGTNYTYLVSADGYAWLQFYQETIATAGTPTHIGWGGDAGDTGTATGKNMIIGLRGWEVLASASPQAASALAGI